MMRFRQAKRFLSPSANRNTWGRKVPTTVTGMPARTRVRPTASPAGKKVAAAPLPRMATGAPASSSVVANARPSAMP